MFNNIYKGKTVLVTGHTGFKGSWLCLWLTSMGARVVGYSLAPTSEFNHYNLLGLDMVSIIGDIRDLEKLKKVFADHKPEIVFHLAAQALVRDSYYIPIETYDVNVMGTMKVLEACRLSSSVKAIVNVTSDKCYENREWNWGYREIDPMGGFDPYSSSKGCAEILTASFRNSFFNVEHYGKSHQVLLASARAGNVIGGGDWARDRLVPDIMRAAAKKETVEIRSPKSVRPWQHVLEPLSGYLLLAQRLYEGEHVMAQGWNFGPSEESILSVREVTVMTQNFWGDCRYLITEESPSLHEAKLLKLDSSLAKNKLGWKNVWNSTESIESTVTWYRDFYLAKKNLSFDNLKQYIKKFELASKP